MAERLEALADQLRTVFGERLSDLKLDVDEITIEVRPTDLRGVMLELRDRRGFEFDQLMDLCGVDYAAYGQDEWITERATFAGFSRGVDGFSMGRLGITGIYGVHEISASTGRRFASVCHLLSVALNHRLRVKTFAEDDGFPVIDSIVDIWNSANWFERESFDLYGIIYEGHPDLRRILTDYGFVGHPFRKDFPLIGNVEVRYDPDQARVIYQPVTIEPRVLVPRVIREDNRYADRPAAASPSLTGEGKANG
jgi:NADH-quinone oxidoreductase subunit C